MLWWCCCCFWRINTETELQEEVTRWVPGVLTDHPVGAPRGPAMAICGLQWQFNQRVRLPGNKKRTHSRRSPCPTRRARAEDQLCWAHSPPPSSYSGREAGLLVREHPRPTALWFWRSSHQNGHERWQMYCLFSIPNVLISDRNNWQLCHTF